MGSGAPVDGDVESLGKLLPTTAVRVVVRYGVLPENLHLDLLAFMVSPDRRLPSDRHLVFFNNIQSPAGDVKHANYAGCRLGDDDDWFLVDLPSVSDRIAVIEFVVYKFDTRESSGLSLGHLTDAHMRIIDHTDGRELATFPVRAGAPSEADTALVCAELRRSARGWVFRPVSRPVPDLVEFARQRGVDAS